MLEHSAKNSKFLARKYCNSRLTETLATHIFPRTIHLTRSCTREPMTTTRLVGGTKLCPKSNEGRCAAVCVQATVTEVTSPQNYSSRRGLRWPYWPSLPCRTCSTW